MEYWDHMVGDDTISEDDVQDLRHGDEWMLEDEEMDRRMSSEAFAWSQYDDEDDEPFTEEEIAEQELWENHEVVKAEREKDYIGTQLEQYSLQKRR